MEELEMHFWFVCLFVNKQNLVSESSIFSNHKERSAS